MAVSAFAAGKTEGAGYIRTTDALLEGPPSTVRGPQEERSLAKEPAISEQLLLENGPTSPTTMRIHGNGQRAKVGPGPRRRPSHRARALLSKIRQGSPRACGKQNEEEEASSASCPQKKSVPATSSPGEEAWPAEDFVIGFLLRHPPRQTAKRYLSQEGERPRLREPGPRSPLYEGPLKKRPPSGVTVIEGARRYPSPVSDSPLPDRLKEARPHECLAPPHSVTRPPQASGRDPTVPADARWPADFRAVLMGTCLNVTPRIFLLSPTAAEFHPRPEQGGDAGRGDDLEAGGRHHRYRRRGPPGPLQGCPAGHGG